MSHQVKTASSIYTLQHRQLSATYVTIDSQNIRLDVRVLCVRVCERGREGEKEGEKEKA